jgi:hypothetical protein
MEAGGKSFTLSHGDLNTSECDLQDIIAEDKDTHGAMFVPGILGSDKTTVSVGTGNTEFYPFYGGIGSLVNAARWAHRDGIAVMAFLSIPKSMCTIYHPASLLIIF